MLVNRRTVLTAAAASAALPAAAATTARCPDPKRLAGQGAWGPPPPQPNTRAGLIDIGPVKLWVSDTGGDGEPVIALHAYTGSDESWLYQRPAFAAAGYRFISYSRRGAGKSERGPDADPGSAASDLAALMDRLGLARTHLVGTAAGGFIVPDFALSFPERLATLVMACTLGGVTDQESVETTRRLTGPAFGQMPAAFRELGPSYRAAYPDGVVAWESIERGSQGAVLQRPLNRVTFASLRQIKAPALLLTGDADLYQPPSRLRELASHMPGAETAIIAESGHSAFWEQPAAFNAVVLDFLRRHRMKMPRGSGR